MDLLYPAASRDLTKHVLGKEMSEVYYYQRTVLAPLDGVQTRKERSLLDKKGRSDDDLTSYPRIDSKYVILYTIRRA